MTKLLNFFFLVFYLCLVNVLSAQVLVGYWENWPGNNYVSLDQVDSRYSVVNIAFAVPVSGTDYDMTFSPCCDTPVAFKSKIQTLQNAGHKVNISIGGAATPIILDTPAERDAFVASMNTIINTYEVDGIDIDLETSLTVSSNSTIANPTDPNIVYFIEAIQQLAADYQSTYGKKMFIGAAPETAFVQGGMALFDGEWGSYLPVLDALRNDIDILHVQLYNSGSMYGLDGGIYYSGTADFIVSQVENVIQGFDVNNPAQEFFTGFPESKIAVGLPACPDASVNGNGFTPTDVVEDAIDYLMGNGPQPGSYTLQAGPYPNLGGMMTWSLNYDTYDNCNDTPLEFATNYECIFITSCDCMAPSLGSDISACVNPFPVILDSQTPTGNGITFTWTNLSTGQIVVNESTTANTLSVSTPGEYRVERTDGSCTKVDDILVTYGISTPTISGVSSLCQQYPIVLNVSNVGDFPGGVSWQWDENFQPISGAINTTLSTVVADGFYTANATYGVCTSYATHQVSSNLPIAIDDCVGPGESASLEITNASDGPYHWYDMPSSGNLLTTGTTYTTPILNSTTSYYVEKASQVGTTTIGPPATGNGFTGLTNWNISNILYFDVHVAFTLKEITVYPLIYGYTHPFSFEIRDAQGNTLSNGTQSFSVTHPGPYGTLMGPTTLTLSNGGITIPVGDDYQFVVTSDVKNNHWEGNVNYPMNYSPYATFTAAEQPNWYPALHDWIIETTACAYRVPVTGVVDPSCAIGLPVELLTFSVKEDGGLFILEWETASEINNAGFIIERKTEDDSAFKEIGWVDAGKNAANGHTYYFSDDNIDPGNTYYYRLAQTDLDGKVQYSPIRQLTISKEVLIEVYPNPTDNLLNINLASAIGVTHLYMKDMSGRLVLNHDLMLGQNTIDTGFLPRGMYTLLVVGNHYEYVERIVIFNRPW